MIRVALIEDGSAELLRVVCAVLSLDPDGQEIEILPILFGNYSPREITEDKTMIEGEFAEQLHLNGVYRCRFPEVDQSLIRLNPSEASDRVRILHYLLEKGVDVILSDCAMGNDYAGRDLLNLVASDSPWKEQDWIYWLMTQREELRNEFLTRETPGLKFDPAKHLDKAELTSKIYHVHPRLKQILDLAKTRKTAKRGQRTRLGRLVGKSSAMQHIYDEIVAIAPSLGVCPRIAQVQGNRLNRLGA